MKLLAVGRIEFLKRYNGGEINEVERRDAELYYMKNSYQVFVDTFKINDKEMNIDHPQLLEYMNQGHPRFFQLVQVYGSPIGQIRETKKANIKNESAALELISELVHNNGKVLKKKLMLQMQVTNLKAMLCKMFKCDLMKM